LYRCVGETAFTGGLPGTGIAGSVKNQRAGFLHPMSENIFPKHTI